MIGRNLVSGIILLMIAIAPHPLRAQSSQEDRDNDAVRDSVVKIYSIRRGYSLSSPWKRLNSNSVTGSGVVISKTQVLTNYHVVAATTDVSISLDGQSERLSGSVEAIAPGIDLAVIVLDQPLPDDVRPLEIAAASPKAGTKIQVFGYPKGGESLSITEGVVSRIEYTRYRYRTNGLRTQIDAPLNNGNSGGPMIAQGKVVGIAFSGLSGSNDIGYAIPCEEINLVLKDIKDGVYDGKPQLWLHHQTLPSKEMRGWLKMPDDATGIRFSAMPIPIDDYPLKANDVITQVGSLDVNNRGKVDYDKNNQVSYGYAVDRDAKEGKIALKILRDGAPMDVEVPVFSDGRFLLNYMFDDPPTYFVYGPIVFGIATAELPESFDAMLSRGGSAAKAASTMFSIMRQLDNPYLLRRYEQVKDEGEQLVVISKLISNRMTRDISVPLPAVVRKINGKPVPNIQAAAEMIDSLEDDSIVIEFEDNRSTTIVLNREMIEKEHDEIMENNGIVNSASKNLRDVWSR